MGLNKKRVISLLFIISILALTLPLSSLVIGNVKAQSSGTFLAETFNGMQISYAVSGITLDAPVDSGDFYPQRNFNGTVSAGSTITVSGTFHMDWEAWVTASAAVSAGSASKSAIYDVTTNSSRATADVPFSVSITVPSDATTGSFSISMSAGYGNGENRGLNINGNLKVEGGTVASTVDHISLYSNAATDYIAAGSSSFTMVATVYGAGNTQVPDGTVVTFSLSDRFATLGGASIQPSSAGTVDSQVTVAFTPPSLSYWNNHNPEDSNRITVTAAAGDKETTYILYITQDDNNIPDNVPVETPTPLPQPQTGIGNYIIPIVIAVVIGVVVVCVVVFLKMHGSSPKSNLAPPPPPPTYA